MHGKNLNFIYKIKLATSKVYTLFHAIPESSMRGPLFVEK